MVPLKLANGIVCYRNPERKTLMFNTICKMLIFKPEYKIVLINRKKNILSGDELTRIHTIF